MDKKYSVLVEVEDLEEANTVAASLAEEFGLMAEIKVEEIGA